GTPMLSTIYGDRGLASALAFPRRRGERDQSTLPLALFVSGRAVRHELHSLLGPQLIIKSSLDVDVTERSLCLGNDRVHNLMPRNLRGQKHEPLRKIHSRKFHEAVA